MELPKARDIVSLAKACRKVGIIHFRSGDVEFTLSDDLPESQTSRGKAALSAPSPAALDAADKFESDGLTEEQLLFYSVQESHEGAVSE